MRLVVNWFAQCSCIHPVFLYSPRLSSIVLPFFHLQRFCSAWVSVSMVQSLLLISHMVQLLTRHLHHIYVTWWKVAKWLPSLGRRWGPTLWVILPRLPNTWGLTNTWGDEGKKNWESGSLVLPGFHGMPFSWNATSVREEEPFSCDFVRLLGTSPRGKTFLCRWKVPYRPTFGGAKLAKLAKGVEIK